MSRSVYRYNVSLCYLCVSLTVSVVSVKRQDVTETAKSVTETSRTYRNFTMAVLYLRAFVVSYAVVQASELSADQRAIYVTFFEKAIVGLALSVMRSSCFHIEQSAILIPKRL